MVNQTLEVVFCAVPRQSLRARSKCASAPGPSDAEVVGAARIDSGRIAEAKSARIIAAPTIWCRFHQGWLFIAVAAPMPVTREGVTAAPLPFLLNHLGCPRRLASAGGAGCTTTPTTHRSRIGTLRHLAGACLTSNRKWLAEDCWPLP